MHRWIPLAACVLVLVGSHPALAETIAVIGTGNVGSALGQRFAELGHSIVYGSRNPTRPDVQALVTATGENSRATTQRDAAQQADIVLLAVPAGVAESVTRELGDLSGRIVIDPTNPRAIADDGLRDFAFHDSIAERIQAIVPDAFVVKAFSTLGSYTMLDAGFGQVTNVGGLVDWPTACDDDAAQCAE